MDEDGFWKIVQRAHDLSGGDMDQKCDALRQLIAALSKDEALEFAQHFDAMMDKAYNWPLWGAAYVINGGCSDDTFCRFSRRVDFARTTGIRARAVRSGLAGGRRLRRIGLVLRRLSIRRHRWRRSGCRQSTAAKCAGSAIRNRVAGGQGLRPVSEAQREIWVKRGRFAEGRSRPAPHSGGRYKCLPRSRQPHLAEVHFITAALLKNFELPLPRAASGVVATNQNQC